MLELDISARFGHDEELKGATELWAIEVAMYAQMYGALAERCEGDVREMCEGQEVWEDEGRVSSFGS